MLSPDTCGPFVPGGHGIGRMSDRHRHIIIVEDDAGMRAAMLRMLRASGHQVTQFGSAEALVESGAEQATQCDCLVLDIRLPGISGIDLCRNLRASGPCPPCILITGHDVPGLHDLALRTGAFDYLRKPFTGTTLLDAIARAVAA